MIRFIRASLTPIERWTRPSSSSRFSSREAVELRMPEGALQILLIDFPALAVAEITDQNALDLRQHALGMVGRPPKPSAQEIGQCLDLIPDVPLMLHGNTSSN